MNRLTRLLFLTLCGFAAPVTANGVVYPDERSLLLGLREFNASKCASVIRKGTHYLIYSGGRGSGFRRFNAFVFREDQSGLVLLHQFTHAPLAGERYDPIISLTPEITDQGLRLLRSTHSSRGIVKRHVWERRFEELKTMPAVDFSFRFESEETLNQIGEQGDLPRSEPRGESQGEQAVRGNRR